MGNDAGLICSRCTFGEKFFSSESVCVGGWSMVIMKVLWELNDFASQVQVHLGVT